ncbi:hypothetical protein VG1_CDS0039 [Arthrobacter phage Cupello]|nr:hypothetical protein VG1_CDS0039 [Arthrobacter phage Cupello]
MLLASLPFIDAWRLVVYSTRFSLPRRCAGLPVTFLPSRFCRRNDRRFRHWKRRRCSSCRGGSRGPKG